MHIEIDDQLLIRCMPQAEQRLLAQIPQERELHHSFSARFRRQMRALCRDERRSPRMRMMVRQLQTAAAVFALALLLAFGTLMSVEAARVQVVNAVVRVLKEYTEICVSGERNTDDFHAIEPTYIPAGYTKQMQDTGKISNTITYINSDGNCLTFTQLLIHGVGYIFDTEQAYTEDLMIASQEVHLIFKRNLYQIYWYDEQYFYSLSGEISKDDIIGMAESVIKK